MEPETFLQAAGYLSLAIAAWPVCKYVIGPKLTGKYRFDFVKESAKESLNMYERCYHKTIEERARITIELGKEGKTKEEISDYLNISAPFPQEFDISTIKR